MAERGKYIVIEGPDGTGKSSQRDLLVARLVESGQPAVGVHEPGETAMGLELERLIKNRELGRSAISNALLFIINRIELWDQAIRPALLAGTHVVADRNWLSTAAYQGHAEGLGIDVVKELTERFLPKEYISPDLTVLLVTSDKVRQSRIGNRGGAEADTFESKGDDFLRKVAEGYDIISAGIGNLARISANGTIDEIHQDIWGEAQQLLNSA